MTTLNIDQSAAELARIYEQGYYDYLGSPAFRQAFLRPLGSIVNVLGLPVLDVGCGEGWLADYTAVPYYGFDGSSVAVETARRERSGGTFYVDRLENPRPVEAYLGTVVFGGLFAVLVKPTEHLQFVELYRERFTPRYFIVYDLERVDHRGLAAAYRLIYEYHASADLELQEVKKHRKILVFQCS